MSKTMNNNAKLIASSAAKSLLFWISLFLFWLLKEKTVPNFNIILFFLPYYILWIILMVICVVKTGCAMKILWLGNLRNSDVFSGTNLPYALSFLVGCLILTWVQYYYIWW